MIFFDDFLNFQLLTPDYEVPVFGYKVGELRLLDGVIPDNSILPLSEFETYLSDNNIRICTFRGKENIHVIQLLEKIGFKFISTYNIVECERGEFAEIQKDQEYKISIATPDDYDDILEIEKTVQDYSTFSIDHLIDDKIASVRNSIRVKSHFTKPNHRIYVVKVNNVIAGFIQFVVDIKNKRAETLNAAIHPEFQKVKIGKSLFSDAFKTLFKEGCKIITSDYSSQNIGSAKLHKMCKFRIVDQEIHLRYYLD